MIGNVYRGEGFRGLVDYLAGREGSRLLETNLDGATPQSFARQVGEVRQLHPKEHIADPVCHIPLRPAPGEDLTEEQWNEVLELTLERMGFANSPYVAYLHDHGDGRHLHIAAYRVTFEGKLVSDSNDRFRVMAVAREIEQAYGLTVATPKHPIHLTRPALERLLRDPDRVKVLTAIRKAVDQAGAKHDTVRAFLTELHRLGVVAEIKVARRTGVLQGIRFALPDGHWIKGSELGKNYSLARICQRHELRFDRRSDGRYVVVSEVTDKELRSLEHDGLAPDQVVRYGSRRTLFWELPQEHESGFVDLVATRLPHRFLTFAEDLPRALEVTPDLEERARRVRLLLELVEAGPEIAPPLSPSLMQPLAGLAATESGPVTRTATASDVGARCCELSTALLDEGELPPASAVALRAAYHEAMVAALSRSPLREERGQEGHAGARAEVEPAQLSAFGADLLSGQGAATPEIEPAQFPVTAGPTRVGNVSSYRSPRPIEGEAALIAASRYEQDGSPEAFRDWARLQQALRRAPTASRERSTGLSRRTGVAALEVLARDLREAHERFEAEPSGAHREELTRRLEAYEALARQVETPGARRGAPLASGTAGLEVLKTELLSRHDRYLSEPTPETEEAWRRARRSYEAAVSRQRPQKSVVTAAEPARAIAREVAIGRDLRRRLHEDESQFLEAPRDREARDRWVETLGELRESEARLAAARTQHVEQLGSEFRQSASTLAFYERAYFRSPSPLSERLWRQAERAHLRSSLLYERARLDLDVREERRPRQERPAAAATASLTWVFEKQLLGRELQGKNLARRAAREAWAETSIGRAMLAAAHPLRSFAQASPATAMAADALGVGSEVVRRSLLLYAELRAARDRFRSSGVARAGHELTQGDFSSRSLAAAVIRHRMDHRVVGPAHSPASLTEAVKSSRSAEAALLRSYRSFRRGLAPESELAGAAARALAARAAVTAKLHQALGIPSYRDFTAVLGSRQGRAVSAWVGTLQRAGLSARAVASCVAEAAPFALASGVAAVAVVSARRLTRWVAHHLRTHVLEILREQNEQRR